MKSTRYALVAGLAIIGIAMSVCLVSAQTSTPSSSGETSKHVTIQFKDVPIKSAIQMLFDGTGLNYAVDPTVQGTVNVSLVDVPFADALSTILKISNPPLTVRKENGIYMIAPQKEEVAAVVTAPPAVTAEAPTVERKKTLEKISIGYADVYDIATIFGAQIVQSRATQMSGGSGGMGGGMGSMGSSMGGGMSGFGSSGGSSFGGGSTSFGGGTTGGSSGGHW
jgi:hypothetical protein